MKSILIYSGKGGVGKTTITSTMASALLANGKSVFILDADVNTPSMQVLYPDPTPHDKLLVASMGYNGNPVLVTGGMTRAFFGEAIKQINRFNPDFVLIDTPPSVTDVHISLVAKLKMSGIILVTQPTELSRSDVSRTVPFFSARQIPVIGIIENMVGKEPEHDYVWSVLARVKRVADPTHIYEKNKRAFNNIVKQLIRVADVILENRRRGYTDGSITVEILKQSVRYDHGSGTPLYRATSGEMLPLRFINVQTWDFVRDEMDMSHYTMMMHRDRFLDVCTAERIQRMLDAFADEDEPFFMVTNAPRTEIRLYPGEIGKCTFEVSSHYGVPRVVYHTDRGNVVLFPHEIKPATLEDIRDMTDCGCVMHTDGRYIPNLFNLEMLYNAFGDRVGLLGDWKTEYIDLYNPDPVNIPPDPEVPEAIDGAGVQTLKHLRKGAAKGIIGKITGEWVTIVIVEPAHGLTRKWLPTTVDTYRTKFIYNWDMLDHTEYPDLLELVKS